MAAIKVTGMSCMHCVASVTEALEKVDGVSNVKVDLTSGSASYDGEVSTDALKQAVTAIGFGVED